MYEKSMIVPRSKLNISYFKIVGFRLIFKLFYQAAIFQSISRFDEFDRLKDTHKDESSHKVKKNVSNFLAGKKFPLLLEKAKKGFHDLVIKCNFSEKAKLSPFLAFFCRKRRKKRIWRP